jgi:tetratricopeptide (TPR) repeat protein
MPKAPEVYAKFLSSKGHEKHAGLAISKLPTWGDTQTEVVFLAKPDYGLLEENDMTDDHPDLIPFATVGKDIGVSAFLVIDSAKKDSPVLLCDEGVLHPVAKSFDAFLKKLEKKVPKSPFWDANSYGNRLYAMHEKNEAKDHQGAVKIFEEIIHLRPPTAADKLKKGAAEKICYLYNSVATAKKHLEGKDPVADWETSIAWAKKGKVSPRFAYLNMMEYYASDIFEFEKAIKVGEEMLALEPDDDYIEFYCRKEIGFCYLGLGDDAKAEEAYQKVHQRFGKDAEKTKEVLEELTDYAAKLKSKALAKKIGERFKSEKWK